MISFVNARISAIWSIFAVWIVASTLIGLFGVYLQLVRPGRLGVAAMDPFFGIFAKKRRADLKDLESRRNIDADVLAEEKLVMDSLGRDSAIRIAHLQKTFGEKVAVQDISLNIKFGETFGLLG